MPYVGGYNIVDFSDVTVNISGATGSVTVDNVNPIIMEKLKNLEKPVMVANLTIIADGAAIHAAGFTQHIVAAGVHTHAIQGIKIATMGDKQIQFTVSG